MERKSPAVTALNQTIPGKRSGQNGNEKDDGLRVPDVDLLRVMLISRECDRREGILLRQGRGWLQIPAMGQEGLAALAYAIRLDDLLMPYYRDRPLLLARGIPLEVQALDFLGAAGSTSDGRNMAQHSFSRELNVFPPSTPVGAQCLPAVGAAMALARSDGDSIVLCCIGDAGTRQGEFYEAVCLAIQDSLPIIFVVVDNHYGISTCTTRMIPFRLGIFPREIIIDVDGADVEDVFRKARRAVRKARARSSPSILWCDVERLGSHTSADDQRRYRPLEELEQIVKRDPIEIFARKLIDSGALCPEELDALKRNAREEVDNTYEAACKAPKPTPHDVFNHLFGPQALHDPVPAQPNDSEATIVEAVNHILHTAMEHTPEIIIFGQDIEDPKGGVFGFTKGLSTRFPGRVINAPLAEATIVGTAVGLAALGYKPVFEIQFIDFIPPAFTQLASQLSSLRWRSLGQWACPAVIYAPCGAYLPGGGPFHSQSNEAWWAHIPGLRLAVPSTPEDAAGIFWSAIQDQDPSLILLPKHLARVRMPITEYAPVPFGKAALRTTGTDVTLVTWGNGTELARLAAKQLNPVGVSIEIIDLRSLVPCDWDAVHASIEKTGRLVVLQEDNITCGFGQAVVSEMTTVPDRFNCLLSPPQLVARPDIPVPYNADLEYAVLPDVQDVIDAIYETLE